MKVITYSKVVTVVTKCGDHTAEIPCNPGERLIFDDDNALTIQQNPGSARYIHEVSDLGPMIAEQMPERPKHLARKKLLIYRNRGIGDQLICSAASRFLTEIIGAECHQLSDRVHEPLWAFNPYIQGAALKLPMHLDAVWRAKGKPFYDVSYFFESLTEWDSDAEQPNVYDRLFAMLGFDPARVPAKYKRPTIGFQRDDINKRIQWITQVGNAVNKPCTDGYIVFQTRATNKPRSLPFFLIEKVLMATNDYAEKLKLPILVIDNQPLAPEVFEMVKRTPMAINVATAVNNVRLLLAVIAGATTVIGPDSAALHVAAAQETPAIGLWGPFSPESRTKYYPRQIHLHHKELCENSPCFNYLPELPYPKCPRGVEQKHCECFEGITPEEIFEALKNVNS